MRSNVLSPRRQSSSRAAVQQQQLSLTMTRSPALFLLGSYVLCQRDKIRSVMTSQSGNPPTGQSLALFVATALIHRGLIIRRDRRAKRKRQEIGKSQLYTQSSPARRIGGEPPNEEDYAAFYRLDKPRRISFDGHASFTATSPPRPLLKKNQNVQFGGEYSSTDSSSKTIRIRSPIQENGEEESDSSGGSDDDGSDEVDIKASSGMGILRRMSSQFGRGISFFVEDLVDDGIPLDECSGPGFDENMDSTSTSGTSLSASGVSEPSGPRRCISEPEPYAGTSSSTGSNLSLYAHSSLAQRTEMTMRQKARAEHNSRIMPNKVVLIRHGQSEGNVEESLYATTPDNAMKLTALGWDQAIMAGKELKDQVIARDESIHFVVSPYVRTIETFHGILSAWCDPKEFNHIEDPEERKRAWYSKLSKMGISWHEDPRIREQDFGNYQDPDTIKKCKRERYKFGTFYYRFPHGESASDVYDRVSTFLDSLWRSFDVKRSQNYVLITHGISIRILLSRYFRYSIDQFNLLANPKNCDLVVLGHDGKGRLRLEGRHELVMKENCEMEEDDSTKSGSSQKKELPGMKSQHQSVICVEGYRYRNRLRTIPHEWRTKATRNIRLSFDDSRSNK